MSKRDIIRIAHRLSVEKDKGAQRKLMWIFTKVKYPLDYRHLLEVATKRNRHYLQDLAVSALALFRNSEVREFALRGIENPRLTDWELSEYLDVLKLNYRAGDDKLLANLIKECSNENRLHSIGQSCIAIYENVKSKKCQVPLELLYDKTRCGHCRSSILQILITNHVLSERILREIQYDSALDLRALYEQVGQSVKS